MHLCLEEAREKGVAMLLLIFRLQVAQSHSKCFASKQEMEETGEIVILRRS